MVAAGEWRGNLYYIKATGLKADEAYAAISALDAHEALEHIGTEKIRLLNTGIVDGLHLLGPIPDRFVCAKCIQGKHA